MVSSILSLHECKVWWSLRFFLSVPFLQAWFISFVYLSLYSSDFTAFFSSYTLILSLVPLSLRLPSFLLALSFNPLLLFYLAFFPFSSSLISWLFFIFIQTAFICFLSFGLVCMLNFSSTMAVYIVCFAVCSWYSCVSVRYKVPPSRFSVCPLFVMFLCVRRKSLYLLCISRPF